MALESIDLLVDVSKVLYNEHIVEQRNRIKELEDEVNKLKAIKAWIIYDDDNICLKCPFESILDKYLEIKRSWCYYEDKGYTYSIKEEKLCSGELCYVIIENETGNTTTCEEIK